MSNKGLTKKDLQKIKNTTFVFDKETVSETKKDIDEILEELDKELAENKKIIDKKTSDYELSTLNKILKKREENKKLLSLLKKKNMELEAFYEIIKKSEDLPYSVEELYRIYESILNQSLE